MHVVFVDMETGNELLVTVSHDVAGLLAACQGESVTFPVGAYKYDAHSLDYYEDEGVYKQELVVYLKRQQS